MSKRQAKRNEKGEIQQGQLMFDEFAHDKQADLEYGLRWLGIIKQKLNGNCKRQTESEEEAAPDTR